METFHLYKDIQVRTHGEIYIGVVGPVRSGKSTFIRRFMEQMVIPHMLDNTGAAAQDELPVSGNGRTVTTVEPKFIPSKAVEIELAEGIHARIRMIDCIGYVIEGATGLDENGQIRMVKTPWYTEAIPFPQAAQIGTEKVIKEHATIGLVLTSDGTTGEFSREEYIPAEQKTIETVKKTGKPFLVILNTQKPYSSETKQMASKLETEYGVPVLPINCEQLKEADIRLVFEKLLYEFPVITMEYHIPRWIETLKNDHPIKESILREIKENFRQKRCMKDLLTQPVFSNCAYISHARMEELSLEEGSGRIRLDVPESYYYEMLSMLAGIPIEGEYQLISMIRELSEKRANYEKVAAAMESVKGKGYGVITPERNEISLKEPEVTKQGNRYGVKISALSPSVHLIRAEIETEIAPIVGNEQQAQDLIAYINENAKKEEGIWETSIFGKTVAQLVDDGIQTKLSMIGEECQSKLQDTMKKIVNDSKGKIICIII